MTILHPSTLHHVPNSLTRFALPSRCYLSDVSVFDVDDSGALGSADGDTCHAIAARALNAADAIVTTDASILPEDCAAAMAIPVFSSETVRSVIVFCAGQATDETPDPVGVFEVWSPIGTYDEVALQMGYYGNMERFQNVSSFVRFDKGNGLPGIVWQQRLGLVQDDLANHPGFLRAAGASADLLQAAVGIPVASDDYRSTAVLISSQTTPIARGIEVWKLNGDSFELSSHAYLGVEDSFKLSNGATVPQKTGILGTTLDRGCAVLAEDLPALMLARSSDDAMPGPTAGLAIPFFDGVTLTSITLLLF